MAPKIHYWPQAIIGLSVFGFFLWGMQLLTVPKIFLLVRHPYPLFEYQGPILIGLAILLAWFRHWAARRLLWLAERIHRWLSAVMMAGVMGLEGFFHILGIPHLEGWWVPLLGGSAAITGIAACFQRWRGKLRSDASDEYRNQ